MRTQIKNAVIIGVGQIGGSLGLALKKANFFPTIGCFDQHSKRLKLAETIFNYCYENLDEAIFHINKYGTKHSESILTADFNKALKFIREIDASAVYWNASTRFTDGNQFGLGAEIGISTQKLHARGPMSIQQLTTTKFFILGRGQIRK